MSQKLAPPPEGPLRTVNEVAALLRTTPQAIYNMRHRGTGPTGVRVGRKLLFAQSEVDRYLADLYADARSPESAA